MMDIRQIRTEADYDWALGEVERYFVDEPVPGSAEAERFDVLTTLIEAYEEKHWAIDAPDAVTMLQDFMARRDLSQADLARLFGSRSRASEILNRKRALTLEQARKLHEEWRIPAEALLQPAGLPGSKNS